jgi:hypothetical protein
MSTTLCHACWHLESPQYNNKLAFLLLLVYSKQLNILCIMETWLSDCTDDSEILPNGYKVYRWHCESPGGGILLAISGHIPSYLIYRSTSTELLIIETHLDQSKLLLCCTYSPPSSMDSHVDNLPHALCQLPLEAELILLGISTFPA